MKTSETTKDKFETIAQSYLGMNPGDKKCATWGEMQRKMAGELLEALEDESDDLYYIQTGYVGNAILWWAENSKGYTAHFLKAGKYTKKQAMNIINDKPQDRAWLCSHVDDNVEAQVLTVEIGFLNRDFSLKGEKK